MFIVMVIPECSWAGNKENTVPSLLKNTKKLERNPKNKK
jgi:hypothetical protein